MVVTQAHVTGFVAGVGVTAVGIYLYKRNQSAVDDWLRRQGLNIPKTTSADFGRMSLEELVTTKETLEDMIAEREFATSQHRPQGEAPATTN